MITAMAQVTLYVRDVTAAKQWYVEALGFALRMDVELAPGWFYVTVSPHEHSETMIELAPADTPDKQALVGRQGGDLPILMFLSDDIDRDYADLRQKGVNFASPPREVPGGKGAGFTDPDGNRLDLFQPASATASA